MKKSELRKSGIMVSGLALGTWAYSGAAIWGASDNAAAQKTIHFALEHGVNLIDTADRYGDGKSEEVVGEALKGCRDKAVLATKVYTDKLRYDDVIACCEASLKRLQTDYIDLYQIHWPTPDIPVAETFRAFEDLKKAGKIRIAGVCNAGKRCAASLADYEVAMNQLPYSLIWRIIEKEVVPASVAAGIPVCAYSPLAQGLLTGKFRRIEDVPVTRRETRFYRTGQTPCRHNDPGFEDEIFEFIGVLMAFCEKHGFSPAQVAMNFLKRQDFVQTILVGARTIAQMEQNLGAYETEIPSELMEEIEKASEPLKAIMGENADMWQGDGGRMF